MAVEAEDDDGDGEERAKVPAEERDVLEGRGALGRDVAGAHDDGHSCVHKAHHRRHAHGLQRVQLPRHAQGGDDHQADQHDDHAPVGQPGHVVPCNAATLNPKLWTLNRNLHGVLWMMEHGTKIDVRAVATSNTLQALLEVVWDS